MFINKFLTCFFVLLLSKLFLLCITANDVTVVTKLDQPSSQQCTSTKSSEYNIFTMECPNGIYRNHLNKLPKKNFTDIVFCPPSPETSYYFWDIIQRIDNIFDAIVCKQREFNIDEKLLEFDCYGITVRSIDCNNTYAVEKKEAAVKEIKNNSARTASNPVTSYVSTSTSVETHSISPFLINTSSVKNNGDVDELPSSQNDCNSWKITALVLMALIVSVIIIVWVYIVYNCLRYKGQRDELRRNLPASGTERVSRHSNDYHEEPLMGDKEPVQLPIAI
uniref:Uncharacterized protein n=1 Tax=Panagrolaimus superbus TaxID=310955 RepID=A0A914ZAL0_9BILA